MYCICTGAGVRANISLVRPIDVHPAVCGNVKRDLVYRQRDILSLTFPLAQARENLENIKRDLVYRQIDLL